MILFYSNVRPNILIPLIALVSLLRLTEIQDVLYQFARLETRTLFYFQHLPPFLHPQILTRLTTDKTMTHIVRALDEGFCITHQPHG